MRNALIIFTRVPVPGFTKTRLMPFLTGKECAALHERFLLDIYEKARQVDCDIFVFYTPVDQEDTLKKLLGDGVKYLPQFGEDLGERMRNAIGITLMLGYKKSVLIGSDCPQIQIESLSEAFDRLDQHDIVIHPTFDGGYYLIGMKKDYESIWKIKRYGTNTVIYDTLQHMKNEHLTTSVGRTYYDIDEKEDLKRLFCDLEYGIITNCVKTKDYLEKELRFKLEDENGN